MEREREAAAERALEREQASGDQRVHLPLRKDGMIADLANYVFLGLRRVALIQLNHAHRMLVHDTDSPSMDATDVALNGLPRALRCPCAASSAEIARNDICPPFGFLRRSALAIATTSGRFSA